MDLRLLLAGAVSALLAVPAAAPAQQLMHPLNKCYVSVTETVREPVKIDAAGFFPRSVVDVFVDNVFQTPDPANIPTADAAGELHGFVSAPFVVSGQRWFTVRLTQHPKDPNDINPPTVMTQAKVTALSVTQSPSKPRTTSSVVRFRGRGFTDATRPIYAHYVYHGVLRRTIQIGKPLGDCGQFSVRRRQFPFKNPRTGTWLVQFDQEPAYNPQASLFTMLRIVVTRKPRG